jgi:hypothetical protein
MKQELQEQLFQKYPDIFKDRNKPPQVSAMCFGIDCMDGWYKIIDELCEKFDFLTKSFGSQVVANQVKEKYGTLRFYISADTSECILNDKGTRILHDIMDSLLVDAEGQSAYTCEICGRSGESRNLSGWVQTLCDKCYEAESEKRGEK